ncbi:MAG: hypothetical protein RMY33_023495 [Nostoc sp. DedQUE03]|nr:hypothetical protein [Nostoc sp. DedQUE02]
MSFAVISAFPVNTILIVTFKDNGRAIAPPQTQAQSHLSTTQTRSITPHY